MQRAVHVGLWRCNIVFKPAWQRFPARVDHAERGVAVIDGVHDDTDCDQIVDFVNTGILPLHLTIDAVEMLRSPADAGLDARRGELFANDALCVIQRLLSLRLLFAELAADVGIFLRHHIHEGKILHLALDGAHAETMRQRSVDLQRFLGFARAFVWVAVGERTHVVQTVRKFDDHDADIRRNGEK